MLLPLTFDVCKLLNVKLVFLSLYQVSPQGQSLSINFISGIFCANMTRKNTYEVLKLKTRSLEQLTSKIKVNRQQLNIVIGIVVPENHSQGQPAAVARLSQSMAEHEQGLYLKSCKSRDSFFFYSVFANVCICTSGLNLGEPYLTDVSKKQTLPCSQP